MSESRFRNWREGIGWWFAVAAALWFLTAATLLLVWAFGLSQSPRLPWYVLLYLALTVAASLVAFVAYGLDKRRAKRDQRRIPERMLHLWSLIGGWPGALFGQRVFRHKTQKLSFRLAFWLIVGLHLAAMAGGVYLLTRPEPAPDASPPQPPVNAALPTAAPLAGIRGEHRSSRVTTAGGMRLWSDLPRSIVR